MDTQRLEHIAPALVARLREARPDELRIAAAVAIRYCLARIDVDDDRVSRAMDVLRRGVSDEALSAELRDWAKDLDERYWEIQERPGLSGQQSHSAVEQFGRARIAQALSFALDLDPLKAAAESIYEAFHAVDDGEGVLSSVERSLKSAPP